ncbi:MAG: adenylosuccinate lyase [Phycisphaerales bacterium]|nr:MAG: adenylosuccinate lyase [Phycisphaerales bacterium]
MVGVGVTMGRMTDESAYDTYASPLALRNASAEMLRIWSPRQKFDTWRRIWLAVAQAQHEATADWAKPLVTAEQVQALRAVVEAGIGDQEIRRAAELERELRHDVMAHVHCLGERCPPARGIIHLGCTSQDVVCNADLALLGMSRRLIHLKLVRLVVALGELAERTRTIPTLGLTHYQPAQPTTVGRRAAGWGEDLALCEPRLAEPPAGLALRGLRGATGTQASFLQLLGDGRLVDRVEALFIERLVEAMPQAFPGRRACLLTGQTYPRVLDAMILADLACVAAVVHKIATDLRLLSNRKEVDEPFGRSQIGSSAMPYKRNPMKCERACGLSRFVMNLLSNATDTAATQWLERTLDDSSNRRLTLPEAFLALDGALDLMHQVVQGLVVHEAFVRRNLLAELPFLATENILMEAVKAGGDRQALHEKIRVHAQAAGMRVKQQGLDNDLIERLRGDEAFSSVHHLLTEDQLLDPMRYVGRATEQVDRFLAERVRPLRDRYAGELDRLPVSDRGV